MNFRRLLTGRPYVWVTVVVLWGVAYLSQIHFDSWRLYSPAKINATYNEFIEPQPLSPTAARLASFGATEFAADLYWLELIQYYGGGDPRGEYRKLAELFQTITELSPRFKQAYITGLIVLPGEGFVDEAISLGEKGQQNLPESWEMPYYTGLVYHIYKKDYAKAGSKFNQAAEYAGAPAITRLFAGIYFQQADQRRTAYLIFTAVAETSDNDYVVERAEKYLGHLDGIFLLEKAVGDFQNKFGRLPRSLAEVAEQGLLKSLPVSPIGADYTYDPRTGKIGETNR